MTAKADEERKRRPNYRPIIDHDGLPRQRSSNQVFILDYLLTVLYNMKETHITLGSF